MANVMKEATIDKEEPKEVQDAKKNLHSALTVVLNKLVCPLLVQKCWNYAVEDKPISYGQSIAVCFAVACVKSFANFSSANE